MKKLFFGLFFFGIVVLAFMSGCVEKTEEKVTEEIVEEKVDVVFEDLPTTNIAEMPKLLLDTSEELLEDII